VIPRRVTALLPHPQRLTAHDFTPRRQCEGWRSSSVSRALERDGGVRGWVRERGATIYEENEMNREKGMMLPPHREKGFVVSPSNRVRLNV